MKKILVIEDDFAIQSLTVKALQTRGFRTLTAPDGLAGLEVPRQQLPDLIICDIQMPRMNGYETLMELRKDPTTATIPFIFLTGLTDRRELRQGMGLGADDYLTKPFSVNELMQAGPDAAGEAGGAAGAVGEEPGGFAGEHRDGVAARAVKFRQTRCST